MNKFKRINIVYKGKHLTFRKLLKLWITDKDFCVFFTKLLGSKTKSKYRFESPKLTKTNLNKKAFFIVYNEPELSSTANPKGIYPVGFILELKKCETKINALLIPGKGGMEHPERMIIPCRPVAHIGQLNRQPKKLIHDMWKLAAIAAIQKFNENKTAFISTHGLGIPWLHIRIEEFPVHYKYKRFLR